MSCGNKAKHAIYEFAKTDAFVTELKQKLINKFPKG
jgi:hypothetical protein